MLHIIWGILKIIGIIIGILLLLLLTVLLTLILVPVRYRIHASKTSAELGTDVRVSWLLHMVSLSVSVGKGRPRSVILRLFGFRLPFFQRKEAGKQSKKRRSRTQKSKSSSGHGKQKKHSSAGSQKMNSEENSPEETYTETVQNHPQEVCTDTVQSQPQEACTDTVQSQPQEVCTDSTQEQIRGDDEASDRMRDEHDENTVNEEDGSGSDIISGPEDKLKKIWFKIQSVCDKIRHLPEQIRRAVDAAEAVSKRLGHLLMSLDRIRKKPGQLLDMLDEYEIPEIIRKLKKELRYLIKHYGPRRIRGYLSFGTGDPALTGELTGLIYLALPARADSFDIFPDFYEAKLETDFICTGRIRGIHVIGILLRLLMDRQVRRTIGRFMKKGD